MARTGEGAALTQRHRLQQIAIRAAALRTLLQLWAGVDPQNLAATMALFASTGAVILRDRNRDSADAAADYFEEFRAAEEVGGRAPVVTGSPPALSLITGLLRGAGLAGIVGARRRGLSIQAATQNGFTKVAGTASNVVLSGGRDVIVKVTAADSESTGRWQRVTASDPCSFCAMLASRGPVFNARTSRFEAHGACACTAEPVYEGSRLPPASERFREEWTEAQRDVAPDVHGTEDDALNAFRQLREGRAN